MKKLVLVIMAALLLALAACAPAQATAPSTATPIELVVVTSAPGDPTATPAVVSPSPSPAYVRPTSQVGNTPCVLVGEHSCVVFFTHTGEPWGVLRSRAEREMKLGEDLPDNVVVMLIFDDNDSRLARNELVQVLDATEVRVANGGLLTTKNNWAEFLPVVGIPFEDAIFAMREASQDLLADSILDNRDLADAGQLCLESGKEISLLFPCTRPEATIIPTMTPRP